MNESDPQALLASLYQTPKEALGVARRAGIPIQYIEPEGSSIVVWSNILAEARKRSLIDEVAAVVVGDYPGVAIKSALRSPENSFATQRMVFDLRPGTSLDDLEKITGAQSTLLPISFLATGLARARSVARVACGDGSFGSGFLIDGNLFVTNHHVLSSSAAAEGATADFGYEMSEHGTIKPPVSMSFDPDKGFCTSKDDDWTIVRIAGDANQEWGAIPFADEPATNEQFVNIIQHPGGGPKHIALYHNVVVFADVRRIQYLTDTMPGSSGSPVLDSSWRLVAVHHAGGWLKRPQSKEPLFCNEGISVQALRLALALASF